VTGDARSVAAGGAGVWHRVRIGGLSRAELLARLQAAGTRLNPAALVLFEDERFTTDTKPSVIDTVRRTVASLGWPGGATFAQLLASAAGQGLSACPLELAPHLRLQYTDQPEGAIGQPATRHQAPPGSITVASCPLSDDEDVPKGFYLRRMDGMLWLRGYRAPAEHVWSPGDVLVFQRAPGAD
jgi:hypothetical protein